MIVLTGSARSGTSLIGKIIGSMEPAFYLFEPVLTKFMAEFGYNDDFNRILFEDYYLNLIHGRGNSNCLDLSFYGNYEHHKDVMWRWITMRNRSDALEYIEENNPKFILKHTEFQHLFEYAPAHWVGVKYIVVFRNGCDVVKSAIKRGWFTDEWCEDIIEPNHRPITIKVPNYIDDCSLWHIWNPETRAACVWRTVNEMGIEYKKKHPNIVFQFRYEDFCRRPITGSMALSQWLGLNITDLTRKHIREVHSPPKYKFDINSISEPERTRFINLNKRLGYEIH